MGETMAGGEHQHPGAGIRRKWVAAAGAIGLGCGLLPVAARAGTGVVPLQTSHFIQVTTAANTTGYSTLIDNAATNDQPNALLFVTLNEDPGGVGGEEDDSPLGVAYDGGDDEWAIFNEDASAMGVGLAFNVLVVPNSTSTAFVQTATVSNSAGNLTRIDSAATNGKPKAVLQVTQVSTGAFEDNPVGVWYDTADDEWTVFNENQAQMDTAGPAVFNVLVGSAHTGGGKTFVQKANSQNIDGDVTIVDSAITNGDPNAFVLETPNLDPGGKGDTYDLSTTCVFWFDADGSMTVFDLDGSTVPVKAAFNLLMFNG
jgi:hypothetical protein